MSNIKRRHFLQSSGATLAALGLSQLDIFRQADKYGRVLAKSTPRKLALLVGINKYNRNNNWTPLKGCVNDVLLQKELLTHRFGFNPKDILTLKDEQATRKGILEAFEEHLIKQAKPGDVVVFHYSGHGSRVNDPDKDIKDGLNSTFVPIDASLPAGYPNQKVTVKDIMGHTLFLLMSALKTENVTVLLDSCHSGGGKRGNLLVRSRDGGKFLYPSPKELEYQQQWLKRLNLSPQEFINLRRKAVAPGVVIAGAKSDQFAADVPFDDFSAGAFSYTLTRYLWQQTAAQSLGNTVLNVGRSTEYLADYHGIDQDPEYEKNLSSKAQNAPILFVPPQATPAEAVVTKVDGNTVQMWLGGLDPQSLQAFKKGSIFSVIDNQGNSNRSIRLESRKGLTGTGKILGNVRGSSSLKEGILLHERIRTIPKDIALNIGLDDISLDKKTREQAKQVLETLNRVKPVPLGEEEVRYIFGLMTESKYKELQQKQQNKQSEDIPPVGRFGLFLASLDEIVPASFGNVGESVSAAIKRLQPKFKSLLAAKVVKIMLGNIDSSRMSVTASMTIANTTKIISKKFPIRGAVNKNNSPSNEQTTAFNIKEGEIPKLPLGTEIAFQVENQENFPIYVAVLVIDSKGEMAIIFPNNWSGASEAARVDSGNTLSIPDNRKDRFSLNIIEPLGSAEALIIGSKTPLRNSLKALQKIAKERGVTKGSPMSIADELLEVTDSLIEDLDRGTRAAKGIGVQALPVETRGIDVKQLVEMSIPFEVIAKS